MSKPKLDLEPDGAGVSKQIREAVDWTNETVLSSSDEVSAGMATLAISQASAMAVQDAEAYMRNVMTVSTAVYSAAFGEAIRNPAHQKELLEIVSEASSLVSLAISQFAETGKAASDVVLSIGTAEKAVTPNPSEARGGKPKS